MLYIEGGTQAQRQLAHSLYDFCLQALNIQQVLDVDLRIQDLEHAHAWTDHEGKTKFYIDIEQDLNELDFITTFCHEMVHVCQYLSLAPVSEQQAYQLESKLAQQYLKSQAGG